MTYPRSRLLAGLAAIVVVGLGVGLYLFLATDGGPGPAAVDEADPRAVAQRFTDIQQRALRSNFTDFDVAEAESVVCGADHERMRQKTAELRALLQAGSAPNRDVQLSATDVEVDGDRGRFTVVQRGDDPHELPYALVREQGAWRVCGLYGEDGVVVPSPARPSR